MPLLEKLARSARHLAKVDELSEGLRGCEPVVEEPLAAVLDNTHEHHGERLLHGRELERAAVERLHTDVASQLLDSRASALIADPDVAWLGGSLGCLLEQCSEV